MKEKVLVVDDDKRILISLKIVLESVGQHCLTAQTGEEGIELAIREHPDIILLATVMPGMDGWETLRRLKEEPATAPIPVVILTPADHSSGTTLAREHGAVDYFPKPFEPDELISVSEKYASPSSGRTDG